MMLTPITLSTLGMVLICALSIVLILAVLRLLSARAMNRILNITTNLWIGLDRSPVKENTKDLDGSASKEPREQD